MKRQIRLGVFETNSSSQHTLSVMTKEQYEKWETGDVLVSMEDILNENAFFFHIQKKML